MKRNQWIWVTALIMSVIMLVALAPVENQTEARFHSLAELKVFRASKSHNFMDIDSSLLFTTGKVCGGCHGHDINNYALLDEGGNDVNIYDDWRATMMANSAKDPFWRAKVSHEVLTNPAHQLELETKCTSCHAPAGNQAAMLHGAEHYTMNDMLADTIAVDGVNCSVCHAQSELNLGTQFSGQMTFDTTRVAYGPYQIPFTGPMTIAIGVTPIFSPHINNAGQCASCHTLITESVDLAGQLTGNTFVEQATYHEWLNSNYNTTNITCQGCHIPRIEDGVIISSNYAFLQPRSPFGLHQLVGANAQMLGIMRSNITALGINATETNFDTAIARTNRMLQQQSLDVSVSADDITLDTAFVSVKLTNKAGHKFPSGYPSRRAFVSLLVTSEAGDTLFHSGKTDDTYEVIGQDAQFEPHFNVINNPNQVQIYELVLGDVAGQFTTLLERSNTALKDNRIAPFGYSTTHYTYDTCQIVGAENDLDFNHDDNGTEGSGTDIVHYHIPLNGFQGHFRVAASVYYQSMPPKWMAPMFAENTPQINTFRDMFDAADLSPILVGSAQIDDLLISKTFAPDNAQVSIFPNPTSDGKIQINYPNSLAVKGIRIYDPLGKLVIRLPADRVRQIVLPDTKGIYLIVLETQNGTIVKKVVRN